MKGATVDVLATWVVAATAGRPPSTTPVPTATAMIAIRTARILASLDLVAPRVTAACLGHKTLDRPTIPRIRTGMPCGVEC